VIFPSTMRKLTVGLLILMAGWGLGWYSYNHWGTDPNQSAQSVIPAASDPVDLEETAAVFIPAAPGHDENIASLLQHNEYESVLERYESLQLQAGEAAVADTRTQILSHARWLIEDRRFNLAEELLQRFLVAAYRDVEARILLAAAYRGQEEYFAAIDQLYEARGYAYRPAMLARITARIRSMVAELRRSLKNNDDQSALLALYQHLIQMEPDHAPWFMGLATTQLALDDKEAARRSLLLVSQDPDVGAQAQMMLSELSIALAGVQDTDPWDPATELVGIPLHRSGNHFIVDARPADGRRIRLLIDTGASMTILTHGVLDQSGIRYQDTGGTRIFTTANGPVRAPVYRLDSLSVGDWYVDHLEVGVLDLGSSPGVDGLLGMNFLKHFQFFIDQNEALLRLSANGGK
jgi:clan AA aspartic protease (TIGR02281 family)